MTRVIIMDPKLEIVLHSIQIHNKESVKRCDRYFADEVKSRGYPLDRILIREGLITIMEDRDEIPIPAEMPLVRKTS